MNKSDTRYMKIVVTLAILVFAAAVQAQDEVDGEAYTAESSASPTDQLLSPDTPIEEISNPSESEDPIEKRANIGLVFGLKTGVNFSQAFSDLGTSFVGELEIGYVLPLPDPIGKSIELFITGQYTQPALEATTSEPDPRLPGDGLMHYEITQEQAILTFGALYRIPIGGSVGEWLRPYGALGARLFLTRTKVDGSVGDEAFGENEETATEPGFYGALGSDVFLGPGSAFLEMQISYASLDGYVMRDTNLGALNLALGYRLFI